MNDREEGGIKEAEEEIGNINCNIVFIIPFVKVELRRLLKHTKLWNIIRVQPWLEDD